MAAASLELMVAHGVNGMARDGKVKVRAGRGGLMAASSKVKWMSWDGKVQGARHWSSSEMNHNFFLAAGELS